MLSYARTLNVCHKVVDIQVLVLVRESLIINQVKLRRNAFDAIIILAIIKTIIAVRQPR